MTEFCLFFRLVGGSPCPLCGWCMSTSRICSWAQSATLCLWRLHSSPFRPLYLWHHAIQPGALCALYSTFFLHHFVLHYFILFSLFFSIVATVCCRAKAVQGALLVACSPPVVVLVCAIVFDSYPRSVTFYLAQYSVQPTTHFPLICLIYIPSHMIATFLHVSFKSS